MSGFPSVLSINCIFTEEEIDFVIFWIVTLWYQVSTNESRIWENNAIVHVITQWIESLAFLIEISCDFAPQESIFAPNGEYIYVRYIVIH